MKLGVVIDGHTGFVADILADWRARYETRVFQFSEINLPFSKGRVNQWRLKRALQNFIESNDLIFFEWAGPLTILASHLPFKKPAVVRLHSWELYEFAPHIDWERIDGIILVSQAMRRRFLELFPEQSQKVKVIPAGKSLAKFRPEPHVFTGSAAMLGNLIPIKRVYEAILTVYELKKKGYRLYLHLGGNPQDGSDNQRYFISMKSAVEKLGLQDQVLFDGFVEHPEIWLKKMDIFISNSYWEGQQNALIEAMATGCYCLSHFWDGAEEILPMENLFATESELQQKIIAYWHKTEAEKQECQMQLRSIAEQKYNYEVMFTQMTRVFEEFCAKTKA